MEEAIKEFDYNSTHSKITKINFKLEKKSFDEYLDELFSNSNTNGFIIYFTGQFNGDSKQQLVLTNKEGDIIFYEFINIIKRWHLVPNYENKHLLIIVDAENSGVLNLKKTASLNNYEEFLGITNG